MKVSYNEGILTPLPVMIADLKFMELEAKYLKPKEEDQQNVR